MIKGGYVQDMYMSGATHSHILNSPKESEGTNYVWDRYGGTKYLSYTYELVSPVASATVSTCTAAVSSPKASAAQNKKEYYDDE